MFDQVNVLKDRHTQTHRHTDMNTKPNYKNCDRGIKHRHICTHTIACVHETKAKLKKRELAIKCL